MPIQSGVSVTVSYRGPTSDPDNQADSPKLSSLGRPVSTSLDRSVPKGVELESDSDSGGEDDYLATSHTQRKLAALASKHDTRPVPVQAPSVRFDGGGAQAISPTSRRRTIIMREMSESLRRSGSISVHGLHR